MQLFPPHSFSSDHNNPHAEGTDELHKTSFQGRAIGVHHELFPQYPPDPEPIPDASGGSEPTNHTRQNTRQTCPNVNAAHRVCDVRINSHKLHSYIFHFGGGVHLGRSSITRCLANTIQTHPGAKVASNTANTRNTFSTSCVQLPCSSSTMPVPLHFHPLITLRVITALVSSGSSPSACLLAVLSSSCSHSVRWMLDFILLSEATLQCQRQPVDVMMTLTRASLWSCTITFCGWESKKKESTRSRRIGYKQQKRDMHDIYSTGLPRSRHMLRLIRL